jgi:tartrate-resistant acid phosphatase type 5
MYTLYRSGYAQMWGFGGHRRASRDSCGDPPVGGIFKVQQRAMAYSSHLGRKWPRTAAWTGLPALLIATLLAMSDSRASTVLGLVGDYGETGERATSIANMVGSFGWQTDYVLSLGDNNSGNVAVGNPDWETLVGARYGQYMMQRSGPGANPYPYQTSSTQRFFPIVGDHDLGAGVIAGYVDYFHDDPANAAGRLPAGVHTTNESYYDFELPINGGSGSIHVFAMNSESFVSSAASQAAQIEWLRNGLTSSTAAWNFVTLHRPPFSSGFHNSSQLLQLPFQQWGADAVFSGHDHLYERLRVTDAGQNQMLYIINGTGGAHNLYPFTQRAAGSEFRYNGTHGAMRATITDDEARFEFFAVEIGDDGLNGGTLVDSYTLLKSNLPTPPVLTADFNADGFVDDDDLSIWQSAFGATDTGDADGDGDSDGGDFLAWQTQRSTFQPIATLTSAIPEPAAEGCFLLAAISLMLARRSHTPNWAASRLARLGRKPR